MKFNKWTLGLISVAMLALATVSHAQTNQIPNLLPPINTSNIVNQLAGSGVAAQLPAFDSNGLDFTNVNYAAKSGMEYAASGGTLAWLEFDADLIHGNAVDFGLSASADLSASGSGLHSAEVDAELIKNFSNFQLCGKAGVGGVLETTRSLYGDVVVEVNYNLTKGTGASFLGNASVFTFVGANVELEVDGFSGGAANLNKVFHIFAGVEFKKN